MKIFVDERNSHTVSPFHYHSMSASKKLLKVLPMQLFVLQRIVYAQMEENSSNRLTAAILDDCRLESKECGKDRLTFVIMEEVL